MRKFLPLLVLAAGGASADEGMWTVDNFPAGQVASRYGVDIDQAWLDRVRLATTRASRSRTRRTISRTSTRA